MDKIIGITVGSFRDDGARKHFGQSSILILRSYSPKQSFSPNRLTFTAGVKQVFMIWVFSFLRVWSRLCFILYDITYFQATLQWRFFKANSAVVVLLLSPHQKDNHQPFFVQPPFWCFLWPSAGKRSPVRNYIVQTASPLTFPFL